MSQDWVEKLENKMIGSFIVAKPVEGIKIYIIREETNNIVYMLTKRASKLNYLKTRSTTKELKERGNTIIPHLFYPGPLIQEEESEHFFWLKGMFDYIIRSIKLIKIDGSEVPPKEFNFFLRKLDGNGITKLLTDILHEM